MNTNWKIANAKRKVPSGLVIEVVYIMNFELEGESDRHVGIAQFEGDPSAPGFVPFEQLTEPVVLGWVKAQLGDEKIASITAEAEARLKEKAEKKKNPETLSGLPWEAKPTA